MLEIASAEPEYPINLPSISINQDIPLRYLEQIFLKLKKAGLVRSVKGPGGGYLLNVDQEQIAIIDIIDAVDENTKMTKCSKGKSCTKNGIKCKTHDLWKGLGRQIRSYFASISVADVAAHKYSIDL